MQREYIKCKCNNIYLDSDFTSHFPRCNEFKISFRVTDKHALVLKIAKFCIILTFLCVVLGSSKAPLPGAEG